MPKKYMYNGVEVTEEQIQQAADASSMSIEDYISKADVSVSGENEQEAFQNDPVKETASAGSKNQAVNTDLVSEATSLELPDPDPIKYITVNGQDVYEDEYLEKYAGKENYPLTFKDYAKKLNSEILTVDPVEISTKRKQISISKEKLKNPKQLKKDLIDQGFGVDNYGGKTSSAGVGAPGVYEAYTTRITASNGNEFVFDENTTEEQLDIDLNLFLNENKPISGSKPFIKKHGYTNSEFEEGQINGQIQKPDYQTLDAISNGVDKVLGIVSGKKDISISDINLSYNDFYTFSEDPNINQDAFRTATIDTTVKYLEKNGYIDPNTTDIDYVRSIVKEVVNKNNYFEVQRNNIRIQDQANQQYELGNIQLDQADSQSFKENIVSNEENVDLQERYKKGQDIDRINKDLDGLYTSLETTTDVSAQKNIQQRITLLENQRQAAFDNLKNIPIGRNDMSIFKKDMYSTFTDVDGNLQEIKLTAEQIEQLIFDAKKTTKDNAESQANTYGLTMREALKRSYDDVIKEYMYLDGWSKETKVSIKYRGQSEREVNQYLKNFLGVNEVPQNISVNDFIAFENYLNQELGGRQNLIKAEGPDADLYRKHRQSLDVKRTALDNLYLYNIDPKDIETNAVSMFFESALVATVGEEVATDVKLSYNSGRSRLDNMQQYFNQYSEVYKDQIASGAMPEIKLDKEQKEAFERDWLDEAFEATGGMVPMLAEFALLNYATGGALMLTGGARLLSSLKKSKNIWDRARYASIETIMEELKFQAIEEQDVSFQGAGFYGINQLFKLAPGLKGKKSFFNAGIRNTFGAGISGATASNVSGLIGEYKKSLFNDANFNKYLEDNFTGEDVDLLRKWSVEAASFAAFGLPSLKKENLSWKTYQKNTLELSASANQIDMLLQGLKKDPKKNAEAIASTEALLSDYRRLEAARTNNYRFEKENPNLEANTTEYVNNSLSKISGKPGEAVIVKFVEKQSEMVGSNDVSDKAFFNTAQNTMYFVKSKFNSNVMMHETVHAGIKKHLDLNPGEQAIFNKNILNALEKSLGVKGEQLKEAIKKEYGLDMRFNINKEKLGEEFTAFVFEFLNTKTFAETFGQNEANQSFFGYIKSEVQSLAERSGINKNIDAENVLSVMQRISDRSVSGRNISTQIARLIESMTTGEKLVSLDKQAGKSSKDLTEEATAAMEEASRLFEEGKIDEAAYEIALDQYMVSIKEIQNPTVKKQPKTAGEKQGKKEYNNEANIDIINNPESNRVQTANAWKELSESFDNLALKAIKYDTRKGDFEREEVLSELRKYLPGLVERYDPASGAFSTYVTKSMSFKAQEIYEKQRKTGEYSLSTERGEVGYVNELVAETPGYTESVSKSKGVVPVSLISNPATVKAIESRVTERLAEMDLSKESLGSLPGLATELIAEHIGIPVEKILDPAKNLTQENRYEVTTGDGKRVRLENGEPKLFTEKQYEAFLKYNPDAKIGAVKLSEAEMIRMALSQMGDKILKLFPDLNIAGQLKSGKPVGEGEIPVSGRSIDIPKSVLGAFYSELINPETGKPFRGKNPKSQTIVKGLENISYQEFLGIINKLRGQKFERPEGLTDKEWLKVQRDNGQLLKGLVTWYDKMVTNEIARRDETLAASTRANLEAGKPKGMASKDIKLDDKSKVVLREVVEKTKLAFSDDVIGSLFDLEIEKIVNSDLNAEQAIDQLLSFGNNNIPSGKFKAWTQSIEPLIVDMFSGKITAPKALQYISKFREIHRYEEQTAGYKQSKVDLSDRLQLTSNDPQAQQLLINEWLRNVSRGGRNLGVDGTTNQSIYTNVIKPLQKLYPKLRGKYKVISNKKRGKKRRTYIVNDGVTQRTYNNINYIKSNFAGLKDATAAEALEAKNYIWREIDTKLKQGDSFGATSLLSTWLIDQRGPMRKLAQLGFMEKNIEGKSILEHEIPVINIYSSILEYVNNPTKANKDAANALIDASRVHLISEGLDKLLPKLGENRYETPEFKAELDRLRLEGKIYDTQETAQGNASKDISLTKQASDLLDTFGRLPIDLSAQQAKAIGKEVDSGVPNWIKLKIDPEAQDFLGLMQSMVPRGKEGEAVQAQHKKLFTDPYNRAYNQLDADNVYISSNFKSLKKATGISNKRLEEKIGDTYFTNSDAVRVFIWTKQDREIPGISTRERENLMEHVRSNKDLLTLAIRTSMLNKGFGIAEPVENWITGSIQGDLMRSIEKLNRPAYLREWQANVDAYFTEGNLNKMEAQFGSRWRKSMENSLERQRTGKNRYYSTDSQVGKFADQLSGAVLNTLNLNNKSALLQLTSASNFIDWKDNNPIAAAKSFANQPQYWSDFGELMMSDFLKERRSGLKIDINDADIADLSKKGGFTGIVAKFLKLGLAPTVIADNIAIAGGGATFYRNKINKYLKDGLTEGEAKKKAFQEFREKAETSQQSNRPDKISMQQSGPLGRIVLAYTNTPQQYLRLTNKALNDIKNNRGNYRENVAKIAYYQFMQNLLFTSLQQGVKSALFDEEEVQVPEISTEEEYRDYIDSLHPSERRQAMEDREKEIKERDALEKENKKKTSGYVNTINGMLDTGLKGMGLTGQVISTFKNAGFRAYLEGKKDNPDWAGQIPKDLLAISPGLSTKYGQMQRGLRNIQYNREEIAGRGLGDIENPIYSGIADIGAALTNVPINRLLTKANNVNNFFNEELTKSQRILSLAGWSEYALGIEKEKWSAISPEAQIKLLEWKEEQLKALHPYQRTLYYNWLKEYKKRQKQKNN